MEFSSELRKEIWDKNREEIVFDFARKVAKHYTNVPLLGPTGTGKELVARAIHHISPVSQQKLAVCNCSALVERGARLMGPACCHVASLCAGRGCGARTRVEGRSDIPLRAEDQFYGERNGGVMEVWGNHCYVATHKESLSKEEVEKRAAAQGR